MIIGVILLLLGLLFFSGRGGMLLAGYNTSTKEQKALYDTKKLFRVAGVMMITFALLFMLCSWLFDEGRISAIVMMIIVLAPLVVGIIVANSKYVKVQSNQ